MAAEVEADVVVVGAGVVGCAVARELSRFWLRVVVVEKDGDVAQGATKANSGIVHGGYDAAHGTVKAQLSRKGNLMFTRLEEELDFGFKRVGSLVLAFKEAEMEKLRQLRDNGERNGVHDLEIIDGTRVREMEPHVSVGVCGALYCPSAGIVSPYEYCFALAENAAANGVRFLVGERVESIEPLNELRSQARIFRLQTSTGRRLSARCVVNAAGLYADEVARMANAGTEYSIRPRKGQYVVLRKEQGAMASRVIFQAPTKQWGKGILVSPTARGNLLLGPSAAEQDDKEDKGTTSEELAYVAWAARRSVPHLDTRKVLTSFSGLRARCSRKDFIIEEDSRVKGFVHVAGIESPGLTSSPAIAERVVRILREECGLPLEADPNFAPSRRHQVDFATPAKDKAREGEVVCKCEGVTRAEIEAAIAAAGFPIRATDSVKWRTRAGMGWCQGARCRHVVAGIVAEKLQDGTEMQDVPKRVPGSREQVRLDRKTLAKL